MMNLLVTCVHRHQDKDVIHKQKKTKPDVSFLENVVVVTRFAGENFSDQNANANDIRDASGLIERHTRITQETKPTICFGNKRTLL